jgi:DNA gyrase/topoisomerase IV subunit B
MTNNNYTGAKIQVLKGLEAVRHRPDCYQEQKLVDNQIWETQKRKLLKK